MGNFTGLLQTGLKRILLPKNRISQLCYRDLIRRTVHLQHTSVGVLPDCAVLSFIGNYHKGPALQQDKTTMALSLRGARWCAFVFLTVLLYAVLAGVSQSLAVVALKLWNQEFSRGLQAIVGLSLLSMAAFVFAGWLIARASPLQGNQVRYSLLTLGSICSLVPVAAVPYNLASVAAVRSGLAVLTCSLMLTGARQPILRRLNVKPRNTPA